MPASQDSQCPTCKKVFPTPRGCRAHVRGSLTCSRPATRGQADGQASHGNGKGHGPGTSLNVRCQLCNKGFKSLPALESHMNALGHFELAPGLVGRPSKTTNDLRRGMIKSTANPSTSLGGRREISELTESGADREVVARNRAPPPLPASTKSKANPRRKLKCTFCNAIFVRPSAVAHHIESGRHSITRHQVTAAVYAMNIVPNITIKLIGGPPSFPTTVETYVATLDAFNGVGYKCHLCSKSPFKTLRSLNAHLNSAAHDDCKFECPKCKKNLKLISAFLQHLESGRCGLADIPEITGYFHDFRAQFSGLLKM